MKKGVDRKVLTSALIDNIWWAKKELSKKQFNEKEANDHQLFDLQKMLPKVS